MQKTLEHSKGRWEYHYGVPGVEHNFYLLFGDSRVFLKWPADFYPTIEGDFALMAAAPYLLKAAKKLLWHAKKYPELAQYCEKMKEAIVRATERPETADEPIPLAKPTQAPEEAPQERPGAYDAPEAKEIMGALWNLHMGPNKQTLMMLKNAVAIMEQKLQQEQESQE